MFFPLSRDRMGQGSHTNDEQFEHFGATMLFKTRVIHDDYT